MEAHLRLIGGALIVLALVHVIFPRYFEWKRELSGLSLINRQMVYVHTLFVAFTVFLMGLLCLLAPEELVGTRLGRYVCGGLFAFWLLRLYVQFFVYSSELWRGKRFETSVHIVFSLFWVYLCAIFGKLMLGI